MNIISNLRTRFGDLWWYSFWMFAAGMVANVLNFVVGAFLVPAKVPLHDMGAIAPFQSMLLASISVANIVAYLGLKYTSQFRAEKKEGQIKSLFRHLLLATLCISVVTVVIILLLNDSIQVRFKFADSRIILVMAGCLFLSPFVPVLSSIARGVMSFPGFITSKILLPVARLTLIVLLLERGGLLGYWTATFGATFVLVLFLFWLLRDYFKPGLIATSYKEHRREMGSFLKSGGLVPVVIGVCILVEAVAIRNFTSVEDSAGYYIVLILV
jgi:O-antigen/teichoic acid export membrane protein